MNLCRLLERAVLVAGVLAAIGPPRAALATEPPNVSKSSLDCVDSDGGVLRSGDDVSCTLTAKLEPDTENAMVTAIVVLPAEVEFASAAPPATYDSGSRVITFDEQTLGFTFSSQQRTVLFHVTVGPGLTAGTQISLSSDLTAVGDLDQAVSQITVSSPAIVIAPLVATLAASTLACSDDNGATLLPGEIVTCTLDVINPTGYEDASDVAASISVGGASWFLGGAKSGPAAASFSTSDIGSIASGADKAVSAKFAVPATALGGDLVTSSAFLAGLSTQSSTPMFLSKLGTPLVVSPGPAILTTSSLGCIDSNSGVVLAGDDLTCAVTVRPSPGHEGVQGATATVGIPAGAAYVSGADSHNASSLFLDTPSLGDVVAGAERAATFHIKVADLTPADAQLDLSGTLNATSVPLGGPLVQPLVGPTIIVGHEVLQPGATPPGTSVPTPTTGRPPASYKLRAKTIRIKLRRGHRRANHLWHGSKRRTVFVKRYVIRTPKISGKVVKKVTVPKRGKYRPKRGKVRIKGTRLIYTVKKGKRRTDRFRYTITDTVGKKATGNVVVRWEKKRKK
jgi:hypothetical protein